MAAMTPMAISGALKLEINEAIALSPGEENQKIEKGHIYCNLQRRGHHRVEIHEFSIVSERQDLACHHGDCVDGCTPAKRQHEGRPRRNCHVTDAVDDSRLTVG